MGSIYMSYSSISTHFTLLTFLSSGLTSYFKLNMTLLAFLAVEVVHVGTQFILVCKGRHS